MDCADGYVRAELALLKQPVAKTAAYTILGSESGTVFSNAAASGSVTFTLPTPKTGMFFIFLKVVGDQNVVVTAPTAGTMNHLTVGVTLTNSTTQFGAVLIVAVGTAWYAISANGTWAVS